MARAPSKKSARPGPPSDRLSRMESALMLSSYFEPSNTCPDSVRCICCEMDIKLASKPERHLKSARHAKNAGTESEKWECPHCDVLFTRADARGYHIRKFHRDVPVNTNLEPTAIDAPLATAPHLLTPANPSVSPLSAVTFAPVTGALQPSSQPFTDAHTLSAPLENVQLPPSNASIIQEPHGLPLPPAIAPQAEVVPTSPATIEHLNLQIAARDEAVLQAPLSANPAVSAPSFDERQAISSRRHDEHQYIATSPLDASEYVGSPAFDDYFPPTPVLSPVPNPELPVTSLELIRKAFVEADVAARELTFNLMTQPAEMGQFVLDHVFNNSLCSAAMIDRLVDALPQAPVDTAGLLPHTIDTLLDAPEMEFAGHARSLIDAMERDFLNL